MTALGELCCVALPSLVVIVHVCGSKMHIQFEETPYKLTEEINCFDTKHVDCAQFSIWRTQFFMVTVFFIDLY